MTSISQFEWQPKIEFILCVYTHRKKLKLKTKYFYKYNKKYRIKISLIVNKITSLGGEMVDARDSKSRAKERGGSSPLQKKN